MMMAVARLSPAHSVVPSSAAQASTTSHHETGTRSRSEYTRILPPNYPLCLRARHDLAAFEIPELIRKFHAGAKFCRSRSDAEGQQIAAVLLGRNLAVGCGTGSPPPRP